MQSKVDFIKNLINDGGSATFATIVAEVSEKLPKTGNPFRNNVVTKEVEYHALLNGNYANAVNNRLEKEGKEANFEAKKNWHEKEFDGFNGSILKNSKPKDEEAAKKRYLAVNCQGTSKVNRYFIDGVESTEEEMEQLNAFKASLPRKAPKNQGLEEGNEVFFRTLDIAGIKEIRVNKQVVNF